LQTKDERLEKHTAGLYLSGLDLSCLCAFVICLSPLECMVPTVYSLVPVHSSGRPFIKQQGKQ